MKKGFTSTEAINRLETHGIYDDETFTGLTKDEMILATHNRRPSDVLRTLKGLEVTEFSSGWIFGMIRPSPLGDVGI